MMGTKWRSLRLRTKTLLIFSLFVLLILGLLWLFQVALFGRIFEELRVSEGRAVADAVESELASGGDIALAERVRETAFEKTACVLTYKIVNTEAVKIMDLHTNESCRMHDIVMEDLLHRLYIAAERKGGEAVERITVGSFGMQEDGRHSDTAFCAKLVAGENGVSYLILVNVEVYPSVATVATLRHQLAWISLVIAVFALVAAFFFSRSLTRPIARLHRGAEELARGNYGADFSAPGCRETEELGKTLTYAAEELSKTEMLRRELIANVSHDLRTPLTMIGGYAEVMRDIPGEVTEENLQIIVEETNRLSSLVNDLLDVSRLLSGAEIMHPTRFDLCRLAENAAAHFGKLLSGRGYTVDIRRETAPVWILADEKRIQQVIYNLVGNAVHYAGEDKWVGVSVSVADGRVRCAVSDRGAGISPEDLPRIWERYYKVDKVHRRAAVGTGLGLSIVKNILDAHGAKFGVSSELSEGSTFWFELPTIK